MQKIDPWRESSQIDGILTDLIHQMLTFFIYRQIEGPVLLLTLTLYHRNKRLLHAETRIETCELIRY